MCVAALIAAFGLLLVAPTFGYPTLSDIADLNNVRVYSAGNDASVRIHPQEILDTQEKKRYEQDYFEADIAEDVETPEVPAYQDERTFVKPDLKDYELGRENAPVLPDAEAASRRLIRSLDDHNSHVSKYKNEHEDDSSELDENLTDLEGKSSNSHDDSSPEDDEKSHGARSRRGWYDSDEDESGEDDEHCEGHGHHDHDHDHGHHDYYHHSHEDHHDRYPHYEEHGHEEHGHGDHHEEDHGHGDHHKEDHGHEEHGHENHHGEDHGYENPQHENQGHENPQDENQGRENPQEENQGPEDPQGENQGLEARDDENLGTENREREDESVFSTVSSKVSEEGTGPPRLANPLTFQERSSVREKRMALNAARPYENSVDHKKPVRIEWILEEREPNWNPASKTDEGLEELFGQQQQFDNEFIQPCPSKFPVRDRYGRCRSLLF